MNPEWTMLHPEMTVEHLGLVPYFLDIRNSAPAREQFDINYAHGGGWLPMSEWRGHFPGHHSVVEIQYPGDRPLRPLAYTKLGDETIYAFPGAWFAIVQADGQFEVARMD